VSQNVTVDISFSDLANVEEAVDDGGPTRQFLSEIWSQLCNLTLPTPSKLKLFDAGKDFLQPIVDDQFKEDEEKELARLYYRAIGRIMAYCIRHKFHISEQVLPKLYRNYLLRGLDPMNKMYPIPELAKVRAVALWDTPFGCGNILTSTSNILRVCSRISLKSWNLFLMIRTI
jgi:hypothetical protein